MRAGAYGRGVSRGLKRGTMDIELAGRHDLMQLLELYTHLHGNAVPRLDGGVEALWKAIMDDRNHHIVVGRLDGRIVSSCVMVIVPNLTRNQRPYALVENVVTHAAHRGMGYATRVLRFAREMAAGQRCYKIMLMTGSKEENVLSFYERAGYNREDKTAFVQWLD